MNHLQACQNTNLKFLHIKKEMLCNVALCKLGKREMNHEPQNFTPHVHNIARLVQL